VVIIDFVLNYIIGNLLQMAFRFWALRRFAFPEDNARTILEVDAERNEDPTDAADALDQP